MAHLSEAASAQLFALGAATCFAASQVTVKRGLRDTSVVSSVLISLSTALLVVVISVLLDPPTEFDGPGIAFFALGGLAAPGLSRWATTTGVHRLGPSTAVPITQGARPLIAVIGAVLLLGEPLSAERLIGMAFIVAGGWRLSRRREEARSLNLGVLEGAVRSRAPSQNFFRAGIAFPLIAAAAYAISDLVLKAAVTRMDHPRFGALVGLAAAVTAWGLGATLVRPVRRSLAVGMDVPWLIASGIFAGVALISLVSALDRGDVTLVSPLLASQPLAVFVLSRMILRGLEPLNAATVTAGVSIVLGSIVMSI